jgi:3',5'-nucleoside bisphosphate phosphatase
MRRGTLFADLHTHTTASDGAHTPTMLVQRAFERAVRAIAVTDHDTVAGIAEARAAAEERGMAFLSGLEISATLGNATLGNITLETDELEREVHILGYGVDESNDALLRYSEDCFAERTHRAERIISRLNELKKPLTMNAVREVSGNGTIGRHHIAIAMRNTGLVRTVREAFDKYLADDAPAAVPKWSFPAAQAIQLIHDAGGVAVLAHPARVVSEEHLEALIAAGLDGVEVHHPAHEGLVAEYYAYFTESRHLLASGGSDYHGGSKRDDSNLGRYGLTHEDFTSFIEALEQQRSSMTLAMAI